MRNIALFIGVALQAIPVATAQMNEQHKVNVGQYAQYPVPNTETLTILDSLSNDQTEDSTEFCASDTFYTTIEGDTCDSIAIQYKLSSTALFMGSEQIQNCSNIPAGLSLCLPFSCGEIYAYSADDTCFSIEGKMNMRRFTPLSYLNPWIDGRCTNLQDWAETHGRVVCMSYQAGLYTEMAPPPGVNSLPKIWRSSPTRNAPLPDDASVAEGTTRECGKWHVVREGDTCASITALGGIEYSVFSAANPSALSKKDCTANLLVGFAYCIGPTRNWELTRYKD
ncbi:Pectin lyase fold/virulence factor [Penicillium macrosclerotiorum]|uniref:Pectin lyase fold/virulence factor n=1 Tax=Penicillium macrosclerotiorum TaxID=303699 RepID=UPI0025499325|nr:Pectin lyase fold/virulence factor [Penicillium macrosclerotiorum]KAJ5689374.1 Pectin lyase fold/virulence factor [Penicillium macrosclerotiorum]